MNNKEFIAELATRTGYTQEETQRLVSAMVDSMGQSFENGETVSLENFGTFEVKKRMERVLTNPATGKKMLVPPKLVLGFRPVTAIKQILKKEGKKQ